GGQVEELGRVLLFPVPVHGENGDGLVGALVERDHHIRAVAKQGPLVLQILPELEAGHGARQLIDQPGLLLQVEGRARLCEAQLVVVESVTEGPVYSHRLDYPVVRNPTGFTLAGEGACHTARMDGPPDAEGS